MKKRVIMTWLKALTTSSCSMSPGSAIITVTTQDGKHTATCKVDVSDVNKSSLCKPVKGGCMTKQEKLDDIIDRLEGLDQKVDRLYRVSPVECDCGMTGDVHYIWCKLQHLPEKRPIKHDYEANMCDCDSCGFLRGDF